MLKLEFNSVNDILVAFPDEQSCIEHLEEIRWRGKVISPFDKNSKVYACKNNRYRCRNTAKYFNVKTNTVFYNSNISLQKWFIALWLIQIKEETISSVALAENLKISQKSAWYMLQNLKELLNPEDRTEETLDAQKTENSEIILNREKFQMSEWLKILKK